MSNGKWSDDEWDAFFQRIEDAYPSADLMSQRTQYHFERIWKDVSPRFNQTEQFNLFVENGEVQMSPPGFVLLLALWRTQLDLVNELFEDEEVIQMLAEQIQDELSIGRPDPLAFKECPDCGAENDPDASYCTNCGEEL